MRSPFLLPYPVPHSPFLSLLPACHLRVCVPGNNDQGHIRDRITRVHFWAYSMGKGESTRGGICNFCNAPSLLPKGVLRGPQCRRTVRAFVGCWCERYHYFTTFKVAHPGLFRLLLSMRNTMHTLCSSHAATEVGVCTACSAVCACACTA